MGFHHLPPLLYTDADIDIYAADFLSKVSSILIAGEGALADCFFPPKTALKLSFVRKTREKINKAWKDMKNAF